jgi:hypothetical protein
MQLKYKLWWTGLFLVAAGLFAALIVAAMWSCRPGCFSHPNYERIRVGMGVGEVDRLLGGAGAVVRPEEVPTYPEAYGLKPGAPAGWYGVVWGDEFREWWEDERHIMVGLKDGRVVSKWYWEPSL